MDQSLTQTNTNIQTDDQFSSQTSVTSTLVNEASNVDAADGTDTSITLEDVLVDAALNANDDAFDDLLGTYSSDQIKDAIDQTTLTYIRRIINACTALLPQTPTTDPPNRLREAIQIVYAPAPFQYQDKWQNLVLPWLAALRWTREKYINMFIPDEVEILRRMAKKYFSQTTTYDEVHNKLLLARDLLLSLPNLQLPNVEFTDDVYDLLGEKQDALETNEEFLTRMMTRVHHYFLLCDCIITTQELKKQNDSEVIELETAFLLAPDAIRPLAMARDNTLQNIMLPARPRESAMTPPSNNPNLDIA